jgi:hydroxylamine dehydrogenase
VLWLLPAGALAGMDEKAAGNGLYGHLWQPDAVHEYWDPETFQRPETELVEGRFGAAECLDCHAGVTPGIVKDWQRSRHAAPSDGQAVACDGCHGSDHQALRFPTPADCGACHQRQHGQFLAERRYGFPSHALAMTRAVNSKHFVDKPKAEVTACLQCHSVATKCDSCHTRHRFSAAEARRPEACLTCHSGPPHPDDESYLASAHGRRYLAEGAGWDWSKPLRPGNYPVPTCAYCHLRNGNHQVADKAIWKFGLRQRNPRTAENQVKRKRWITVCADCHDAAQAAAWLRDLDSERKAAWKLLYRAEDELRSLRRDDLIQPQPGQRPPYPLDWWESFWPRMRIGFYEGQASAFYNVSSLERDYFEMWYFDGLGSYKAAAHGDAEGVREGHRRLRRSLQGITERARELRALGAREKAAGAPFDPGRLWLDGPYSDLNREQN